MDSAFRALLVVNWEFPADSSGNLPTLEGARHDADTLRAALTNGEFGLFRPENVAICLNEPVAGMKKAIRAFIDRADDADTLLLYYSGHGERFGSHLYLGAHDTDGADVYATGLDSETISQYIAERNRARNMVVVLDCCHAGAFGDKGAATLELPESLFGEGQYLLASSRWFETSKDTVAADRPSPFTEALSQALLDPRLSGTSGFLTIQEVYSDLYERYRRNELKIGPQKKDNGRGGIAIAKRAVVGSRRTEDYSRLIQTLVLYGTGDELFSVAISPDCKTIAAGTDGAVLLWKGDTEIWRWETANHPEPVPLRRRDSEADLHSAYVYSVAFSPDGKLLASADEDGNVRITSLDGRAVLDGRHNDAVYSVAFAPDGRLAASGGWDRRVVVWDVENDTARRELAFASRVSCVAFSPLSPQRLLAIGRLDNSVLLWDVAGGSPEALEIDHGSSVESVTFSFDGGLLASCGLDKSVRVWDVRNRKRKWADGKEHEYLVRSVAFAPDGETLVSASWDKTMKLWSSSTAAVRAMPFRQGWQKHDDWIWAVTFSSDGKLLASAGSDSRIIIWSLPDEGRREITGGHS
jgi:WD40 repeat protein